MARVADDAGNGEPRTVLIVAVSLIRRPTGSSPGQTEAAIVELMRTDCGAGRRMTSRGSGCPASSGIPITVKYGAVTTR